MNHHLMLQGESDHILSLPFSHKSGRKILLPWLLFLDFKQLFPACYPICIISWEGYSDMFTCHIMSRSWRIFFILMTMKVNSDLYVTGYFSSKKFQFKYHVFINISWRYYQKLPLDSILCYIIALYIIYYCF